MPKIIHLGDSRRGAQPSSQHHHRRHEKPCHDETPCAESSFRPKCSLWGGEQAISALRKMTPPCRWAQFLPLSRKNRLEDDRIPRAGCRCVACCGRVRRGGAEKWSRRLSRLAEKLWIPNLPGTIVVAGAVVGSRAGFRAAEERIERWQSVFWFWQAWRLRSWSLPRGREPKQCTSACTGNASSSRTGGGDSGALS